MSNGSPKRTAYSLDLRSELARRLSAAKAYMREIPDGVRGAVDALDRMFTEHGGLAEKGPEGPVQ